MGLFKSTDKEAMLRKVPVFSTLSSRYLREIGKLMDEVQVKAGRLLVQQGKTGFDFYLIVDGQARVERDGKKIRNLGPGNFFGEISLIDREPRSASVMSEIDMTVLIARHQSFMKLIDTVPGLAKAMLTALCKYIREAEKPSIVS